MLLGISKSLQAQGHVRLCHINGERQASLICSNAMMHATDRARDNREGLLPVLGKKKHENRHAVWTKLHVSKLSIERKKWVSHLFDELSTSVLYRVLKFNCSCNGHTIIDDLQSQHKFHGAWHTSLLQVYNRGK
jgi:hypothetical protein